MQYIISPFLKVCIWFNAIQFHEEQVSIKFADVITGWLSFSCQVVIPILVAAPICCLLSSILSSYYGKTTS